MWRAGVRITMVLRPEIAAVLEASPEGDILDRYSGKSLSAEIVKWCARAVVCGSMRLGGRGAAAVYRSSLDLSSRQ